MPADVPLIPLLMARSSGQPIVMRAVVQRVTLARVTVDDASPARSRRPARAASASSRATARPMSQYIASKIRDLRIFATMTSRAR